ncbi:hypothetical protein HDU77_000305 [Chytriomyces hyalinus]|uniref:ATPase inhibitor, mitochondrial n=1 Tax=Chytriomyces confervae TaxID=246404 RepID=A0A507FE52_9FUNG|nr:hypothetical protein HDU77_000305 [Chytriomyces hyalinus]KAJ3405691.1 hypothetical protein HDU80_000927 [Chytriomyces hyalinus]TPX74504.1 hypothetical protein CcCBS67573_g04217 [Chytriomyces confervae]
MLRSLSSSVTRSIPATRNAAMYSTSAFQKRETAAEEKFVHEHDAELIKKLRKDLALKTTEQAAAAAALDAAIDAAPKLSPVDAMGATSAHHAGAFSKKEAAAEEQYFRNQDKERLEKLKKH